MANEAKTAIESPFLAKDLQQSVKRFVAAGADRKTAQFLANRGGDIVAGVGGDSNTMERYSLAIR
jgi:phage tail tape-measure protein